MYSVVCTLSTATERKFSLLLKQFVTQLRLLSNVESSTSDISTQDINEFSMTFRQVLSLRR